jgi:hypothetical protein
VLLILLGAASLPGLLLGCEQGAEGDRCNPDLVDTSECGSGLSCVTPSTCVISVCCPSTPPYSNPQCACIAHPESCAPYDTGGCNVDAAYDGTPVLDGGSTSGKDANDG